MSGELAAILLIGLVHVLAFGVLIWAMLDGNRAELRGWWPREDGPDAPGPSPVTPPADGFLPLPEATPAAARLRESGRPFARPARRRGDHAPDPARTREPV